MSALGICKLSCDQVPFLGPATTFSGQNNIPAAESTCVPGGSLFLQQLVVHGAHASDGVWAGLQACCGQRLKKPFSLIGNYFLLVLRASTVIRAFSFQDLMRPPSSAP